MSLSVPEVTSTPNRRGRFVCAIAAILALVIAITSAWLYWDNTRLVTSHYTVPARVGAQADGFRIAQVSDLHTHSHGPHNEKLLAELKRQKPDLIAITGDLISFDTSKEGTLTMARFAGELDEIAPTYYVNGNHEVDNPHAKTFYRELTHEGVHVLRNRTESMQVHGERLQIMGINDPLKGRSAGATGTNEEIIGREIAYAKKDSDYSADQPTILLGHRPDADAAYAESGVDVVLVGHNHGGQFRLPLIGGLVSPSRTLLPGRSDGTATLDDTTVVISRGLGNSAVPVRVNNPFELVVVDLARA